MGRLIHHQFGGIESDAELDAYADDLLSGLPVELVNTANLSRQDTSVIEFRIQATRPGLSTRRSAASGVFAETGTGIINAFELRWPLVSERDTSEQKLRAILRNVDRRATHPFNLKHRIEDPPHKLTLRPHTVHVSSATTPDPHISDAIRGGRSVLETWFEVIDDRKFP